MLVNVATEYMSFIEMETMKTNTCTIITDVSAQTKACGKTLKFLGRNVNYLTGHPFLTCGLGWP